MKHSNRKRVSVLLAAAMVITCFLSFGSVSAAALAPYTSYDVIYYFYDFYPTAKQDELEECLESDFLVLDKLNVTEEAFYDLIDERYFDDVEFGSLVIIDIKTFKPDTLELDGLLYSLHSRSCDIILVATYTQSEYADLELDEYVDMYFEVSLEQMELFVKMSVSSLLITFGDITGTCILIDSNMLDGSLPPQTPTDICESNPFFRLLLLELDDQLPLPDASEPNTPITIDFYEDILNRLRTNYNLTFLAHDTGNTYRDVLTWEEIQPSTFTDLQASLSPSGAHFCAFGFWELTSSFYDFLYTGQQLLGSNNLPVYVFEIDSVVNSTSGLVVNTDTVMCDFYKKAYEQLYGETYDERERFLEALLEPQEVLE